ncbi:MAG: TauD/TfdA family dioxygenase [Acidimicrobiales bacterium]
MAAVGPASSDLDAVPRALQDHGYALIDGGPSSPEEAARFLLELGHQLGTVVPQSPRGESVEDVRDFSDVDEADSRGYRSSGELSPHSDPPTLTVLHCLQAARSGGTTRLVDVHTIRDRLAHHSPRLLEVLFEPVPMWRVDGQRGIADGGPDAEGPPVFAEHGGLLSCVYYRPYIEQSAAALGQPLTDEQRAALDQFDHWATSPELGVAIDLVPGQTLVVHNRRVLHARDDYQDWPEPQRRRHLLRLWVDAPRWFDVAPVHRLGDIFAPLPR